MNLILEKHTSKKYKEAILALDVGGTVTQIGLVVTNKNKHEIAYTTEIWTEKVEIFSLLKYLVNLSEKNLRMKIKGIVLAVASTIPPERKVVEINKNEVKIKIDVKILETKLDKRIFLLNDFEALGYSINEVDEKNNETRTIINGKQVVGAPKILIGAGTGLGKAALICDKKTKKYIPLPSEGCYADYPCQEDVEQELKELITKNKRRLTQEDLLSGKGLQSIYKYVYDYKKQIKHNKYSEEIKKYNYDVFLIEKYKNKDPVSVETFRLFSMFYARVISNYFFETLSYGGIYVGGGIAIRNPDIFGADFKKELETDTKAKKFINQTPLYVLANKNLSLIGATIYSEISN